MWTWRRTVRHICYGTFPVSFILGIVGFWLTPSYKSARGALSHDLVYQLGFGLLLAAVVMAAVSIMLLLTVLED